MLYGTPGGRRHRGRPCMSWLDAVEADLRSMAVRRWLSRAYDREEWRRLVEETRVLSEL